MHTLNVIDNIHVLHTLCIIIAIVELIENIKLFFFKVLVFCQISHVYVACANLCCIIVELTSKVLLFAEPQEILFLYKGDECQAKSLFT